MSDQFTSFKGEIILNAVLTGKPGTGDEIATLLTAIHKNANSSAEPDCSTFRTARSGDNFVVFEKYADAKAVEHHFASAPFKAFAAKLPEVLQTPPSLLYYEEFN